MYGICQIKTTRIKSVYFVHVVLLPFQVRYRSFYSRRVHFVLAKLGDFRAAAVSERASSKQIGMKEGLRVEG